MNRTLDYASNDKQATATYQREGVHIVISSKRQEGDDIYPTGYSLSCVVRLDGEEPQATVRIALNPSTPIASQLQKFIDGDSVITAIENILALIRNGNV